MDRESWISRLGTGCATGVTLTQLRAAFRVADEAALRPPGVLRRVAFEPDQLKPTPAAVLRHLREPAGFVIPVSRTCRAAEPDDYPVKRSRKEDGVHD